MQPTRSNPSPLDSAITTSARPYNCTPATSLWRAGGRVGDGDGKISPVKRYLAERAEIWRYKAGKAHLPRPRVHSCGPVRHNPIIRGAPGRCSPPPRRKCACPPGLSQALYMWTFNSSRSLE